MWIRLLLTVLLAVGTSPFHVCHCAAVEPATTAEPFHDHSSDEDDLPEFSAFDHHCDCESPKAEPAVAPTTSPTLTLFVDRVPAVTILPAPMPVTVAANHAPPGRSIPLYISHLALRN